MRVRPLDEQEVLHLLKDTQYTEKEPPRCADCGGLLASKLVGARYVMRCYLCLPDRDSTPE